ncbi:MAG: FecR domain-containing protein [Leptospiraceae bacterium]|nr:FecR domain-containing protein [Leptospiraceae bacterium]
MKRILVSLCMILGLVLYVNCKEKKKEDKSLQAGYVTFAKGDNKLISKDGKEQKITKDMFFFKEDTIVTGKDGLVDIQLSDGVLMRIKQNSKLKLQEILVKENDTVINAKLKLESGSIFTKTTKKLNADSSFVVVTPTSVAGIRGTEFLVDESNGKEQTLVSDGSVSLDILDPNGNPLGKETIIEEGKKGVVENNSIKSQDLSPEELATLKEDSQSIASITADARAEIQKILRQVEDQRQINRDTLNEQLEKNKTELDTLKEKNQELLNEQKQKGQEMIGETKSKTVEEKNAIKQNTNTDEIKGSTTNQLEEMKNKNKIDKSQVAPK